MFQIYFNQFFPLVSHPPKSWAIRNESPVFFWRNHMKLIIRHIHLIFFKTFRLNINLLTLLWCIAIIPFLPELSFSDEDTDPTALLQYYMNTMTCSLNDKNGGNYFIVEETADSSFVNSVLIYVDKRKKINNILTLKSPYKMNCLALSNNSSVLFIGGDFNMILNKKRKNAAAIFTRNNVLTEWDPSPDGTVNAIAVQGNNRVLTGGNFNKIFGKPAYYIAVTNLRTKTLMPWNLSPNGKVETITLSNNQNIVYITGRFTDISGQPRNNYAAFNLSTNSLTDWNPQSSSWVNSTLISSVE